MIDMTRNEIDELLLGALVGRLCMVDPERKPYAIPMPFCWADGSVYLRVPLTGRKGAALAFSNLVCFEVDTYTQRLDYYASVLVEGRLVEVTDPLSTQRSTRVCVTGTARVIGVRPRRCRFRFVESR
jgi:nitroimidazol reductase NimA-like FMN-containing flavoprotein (pyridoxamine 5'-phosphate oxidase superfamily)